jgi:hypothetical protein
LLARRQNGLHVIISGTRLHHNWRRVEGPGDTAEKCAIVELDTPALAGLQRKCRTDFERSAVRRVVRMHMEALEWRIEQKPHNVNGLTTPTYTNGGHFTAPA